MELFKSHKLQKGQAFFNIQHLTGKAVARCVSEQHLMLQVMHKNGQGASGWCYGNNWLFGAINHQIATITRKPFIVEVKTNVMYRCAC
jgi:hypothetical protein